MTSAEFTRWLVYFSIEPDTGTKLDWLITWLGNVVSMSFAGQKACEDGKAIEWGRGEEDDDETLFRKLEAFAK